MIMEMAPAKINLSLAVVGKRADGFHEMEMVMTHIDLADRLTFEQVSKNTILIESGCSFMPLDERNIVYQTAALLKSRFNVYQGVRITIEKNIPVAAGLGGGSSDAAATLRALNRLWKLNLSVCELAKIGEEIGSDVPFCVYGGTALVTGRGEDIQPIDHMPPCWVIVVKPRKGISSWTVFQDLKVDDLPKYDAEKLAAAICRQNYEALVQLAGNALEEVSAQQQPMITMVKEKMLSFGADTALMSGTGPAIFGLCRQYSRAQRIVNGLKGFCNEVYLVRVMNHTD